MPVSEITISCLCGKTLRATADEPNAYCDDCKTSIVIAHSAAGRGPHLTLVPKEQR